MADTGFVAPATAFGARGTGSSTWLNPDNIFGAGSTSILLFDADTTSRGLAASNFDFSSIPDGSTIDGIEVQITNFKQDVADNMDWNTARLILADDSDGAQNRNTDLVDFTGSNQTDTAGGSSELWTETINVTDVKDVDWGFFCKCFANNSNCGANIDAIDMKVYYTGIPADPVIYTRRMVGGFFG